MIYEKEEARAESRAQGREEGRAEGRTQGITEGVLKVVESMIKNKLPMRTIVECSGISQDEILKLANDLNIEVNEIT